METKNKSLTTISVVLFYIIVVIIISLFVFTDRANTTLESDGNIKIVNNNVIIYINYNSDIVNAKFIRYIVYSNKIYIYCFPFPSLFKCYIMNILKIEKIQKKNRFLWW